MSDSLKIEFHADQTMSDSLKIEFHVKTTTLSRLKIELHAQTATLCRLKIEFHVKTTTLCRLKIEMSLLEGTEMRPLRGRVGGKYIIAFFKHELPSIIHELPLIILASAVPRFFGPFTPRSVTPAKAGAPMRIGTFKRGGLYKKPLFSQ